MNCRIFWHLCICSSLFLEFYILIFMCLNVKMRYFRSEFFKIPSDSESATPKTVKSEKISKKTNLQKNDLPDWDSNQRLQIQILSTDPAGAGSNPGPEGHFFANQFFLKFFHFLPFLGSLIPNPMEFKKNSLQKYFILTFRRIKIGI